MSIFLFILIVSPLSAIEHISEESVIPTLRNSSTDGSLITGISIRTGTALTGQLMNVVLQLIPDSLAHEDEKSEGMFSSKYSLSYLGAAVLLIFLLIRRIFRKLKIPEINKYSE